LLRAIVAAEKPPQLEADGGASIFSWMEDGLLSGENK
jgi:hypothetical protein